MFVYGDYVGVIITNAACCTAVCVVVCSTVSIPFTVMLLYVSLVYVVTHDLVVVVVVTHVVYMFDFVIIHTVAIVHVCCVGYVGDREDGGVFVMVVLFM